MQPVPPSMTCFLTPRRLLFTTLLACLLVGLIGIKPARAQTGGTSGGAQWITAASLRQTRILDGAAVRGGQIYAIGGYEDPSASPLASGERYNPATDSWSPIARMHAPRATEGVTAGLDGRIYAIGGRTCSAREGECITDTGEVYTPATDSWSFIAPMPETRASAAAVTGPDGRIYVLGGNATGGCCADPLNTTLVYTPTTNSWSYSAPMNSPRINFAAVRGPDGHIYALGGFNRTCDFICDLASVERYNPATDSWSYVAPMLEGRNCLAAASDTGGIYVAGGDNHQGPSLVLNSAEAYSKGSNSWSTLPPLPVKTGCGPGAFGPDGRFYVIGVSNLDDNFATVYALPIKPTRIDQCKNGGWAGFVKTFKNQDDCVSFVQTGRSISGGRAPARVAISRIRATPLSPRCATETGLQERESSAAPADAVCRHFRLTVGGTIWLGGRLARTARGRLTVTVTAKLPRGPIIRAARGFVAGGHWHISLVLPGVNLDPVPPRYLIVVRYHGDHTIGPASARRLVRVESERAGL